MKKSRIQKYKAIVMLLASFSKNKKLKVGALILKENRIISTGYNGTLPGLKESNIEVNGHDISTVHAEQNALLFCSKHGISTKDCELFVTHLPCQVCIKLCIMAGIKKIYYVEDYKIEENPFKATIELIKVYEYE